MVTGAAAGLALATGGMRLLSGMISKEMMIGMPYLRGLGLNAHVLLFAGLLASIAAMLFSLTPMLNLSLPK